MVDTVTPFRNDNKIGCSAGAPEIIKSRDGILRKERVKWNFDGSCIRQKDHHESKPAWAT